MINQDRIGVDVLSVYKLLINFARIIVGILIFIFGCSYTNFILFLADKNIIQSSDILYYVLSLIDFPSQAMASFLGVCLIGLSIIEIVFVIALLYRKRWGALGIFSLAIVWTFIEIIFVSKFMVTSKMIAMGINILIIFFLYRLITKSNYFKNK